MYKLAICDDDLNLANTIAKVLENEFIIKDFMCEIICVTDDQSKILELVKEHKIDILFLDIDFKNKGKNGIDFASDLRDLDNDFYLIFLSAHIKYMPLSFTNKTFDFLIKPVHKSVLSLLVERLMNEFQQNKIKFLNINQKYQVKIESIVFIEKQTNKCIIHTSNTTFEVVSTIENILEKLPSFFEKCHRSIVINKKRVSLVNNKKNIIIFDNGETCPKSSKYVFRME